MNQRNHIKLLDDNERHMLNKTRKIEVINDFVYVTSSNIDRTTVHSAGKKFDIVFLNNKTNKKRKITIIPEAVEIWSKEYKDSEYSLIDIQQALNVLSLSNNTYTNEFIKKVLQDLK